jgi:hypothetical protein
MAEAFVRGESRAALGGSLPENATSETPAPTSA